MCILLIELILFIICHAGGTVGEVPAGGAQGFYTYMYGAFDFTKREFGFYMVVTYPNGITTTIRLIQKYAQVRNGKLMFVLNRYLNHFITLFNKSTSAGRRITYYYHYYYYMVYYIYTTTTTRRV